MEDLPRYTLSKDPATRGWKLVDDETREVVMRFPTKEHATTTGALEKAVGLAGGSVTIEKASGLWDEKRVYPRVVDRFRWND